MEIIAIFVSLLILSTYLYKIFSFENAWTNKMKEPKVSEQHKTLCFSVIIAFRDEQNNLPSLISALKKQKYNHFEVILINDHSNDSSAQICLDEIKNDARFTCLNLPAKSHGKKKAIAYGVQQSNYHYIITTDADCLMSDNWISAYHHAFLQQQADMVLSPVFLTAKNFFQQLQLIEFFSLMASTAAAAFLDKPIMANAANMAFKKELYLQQSDIQDQKFLSGDDMMLLLDAKKRQEKIVFCTNAEAIIYTPAIESISDFLFQRMRWTSKSQFYRDFDVIYTALLIFSTNFMLLFAAISALFSTKFIIVWLAAFSIKSYADIHFLRKIAKQFYISIPIKHFLLIQLFYPIYILISSFGIFFKPKWKGRKV